MYIIVNKDNNIIINSKGTAVYVTVLNDEYIPCGEELATAILAEEINTVYPTSLFSLYEIDKANVIDGMSQYVNGIITISDKVMTSYKAQKLNELSEHCAETIYDGIDVDTSLGVEHFSLTLEDQINLQAQVEAVNNGVTQVPYHADGKSCRLFTATEITNIMNKAYAFKTYHTTYFNSLKTWVIRSADITEITSIVYGVSLPDDLDAILVALTGKSSK